MKQMTEAKLAELLKTAYTQGFKDGMSEMVEDVDPEEFLDRGRLDDQITEWVESV